MRALVTQTAKPCPPAEAQPGTANERLTIKTETRRVLRRQTRGIEMLRRTVPVALVLIWCAVTPSGAAPPELYTVENYDVNLRPDLANRLLYGEAKIRLHSLASTEISALKMDAGGLKITSVLEGSSSLYFERDHAMLFVSLNNPLRGDTPRTVTVRYQAGPAPGLRFFPDQIYTSVTSDWMPCNCGPGERATLHLTISGPPNTAAAGSGQLVATSSVEGQNISEWQLDSPTEPSWFGFAVGAFAENISDAEGVKLRVLAGTQIAQAKQIADSTAAAMRFLAERTGKHYPGQTYTQVFVHGSGQHGDNDAIRPMAAGLTLLPESFAEGLANQPDDAWAMTNELAHQWYGLAIATKDWSDLWLSEGISAFLADAFLGERFGKERYEREIAHSRQIYNQIRAEGKDRALSDSMGATRLDAGDEIPVHKGTWFLYLVDQLVGDNAFWNGLRLYTSSQWEQAATSQDLQRALDGSDASNQNTDKKSGASGSRKNQKGTAKPLDNLFDLWVYGIPNSDSKSKSKQSQ
jgi:aminopeptidase N